MTHLAGNMRREREKKQGYQSMEEDAFNTAEASMRLKSKNENKRVRRKRL